MATKKNLGNMTEAELKGKTVFLRADLDVPLDDDDQNIAGDDTRIRVSVPTIKFLTEKGAKVILASHAAHPKGVTPKFSLKPLVPRLSELLEVDVVMANDCISEEDVQRLAATLPDGGVLFLEDARFYEEEEKDNPEFAKKLASIVDIYINDAYAHRALPQGERLPGVFAFDINDGIDMVMAMKHGLPDKIGHCGGDSFAVGESMLEDKVIHHISTHGGHHASTKMHEGKGLPGAFSWNIGNGGDSAVASESGKEDKTSHHILVDDVVISKMPVGKSHRTLPDDGDFAYEATSSGGDSVLFSESGGVKGKVIHHIPTDVVRGHASTKVQEGKGLPGAFDWSGNSGSVVTGESGEIERI